VSGNVRVKQKIRTVTTQQLGNVDVNSSCSFLSDNETSTGEDTLFITFFRAQIVMRFGKTEKIAYGISFVMSI